MMVLFAFATNQMENILWGVWDFDAITGFAKQTALKLFYKSLNSSLKRVLFWLFLRSVSEL